MHWSTRRKEEARQTLIGDNYRTLIESLDYMISLRLFLFMEDYWNIVFNGDVNGNERIMKCLL